MSYNSEDSWTILTPIEQSIKEKIEYAGTPLKDWDIKIYRGILTGCNEAFIISGAKKDELLSKDPKSAEIIRPILRGRDIKRYHANFSDQWLLFIPWHFPLHFDNNISGASKKAEELFKEQYPAVYQHLLSFKPKLEKRNRAETGIRYEWYALQRWGAKYWDDFNKPKIIWGNLCLTSQFTYTEEPFIINAPSPMITVGTKYLVAILNSKLADWYIRQLGVTRNGGYFEYKPMFVEKMPIPVIEKDNEKPFNDLVDLIMKSNSKEEYERKINELVYSLYNLSTQEIYYIERTVDSI
ncbi:MAG: TaqI-like C-terminal specificity domain-containing protein [Anaerovibrio sp.]|nr:TaqI-like C-terminal specificity domain-containing protein [Anaerovibrio sp.]